MATLPISHHERVEGHPHRWHVHLHGRSHPIVVELPAEERDQLELADEEIHELLPTALQRRYQENREDVLPEPTATGVPAEAPVRVFQTHFMA
jgi:hypothetical protein